MKNSVGVAAVLMGLGLSNDIYEMENIYPNIPSKKLKRGTYVEVRTEPKIGRNSPCPCGSGKKYKKCCLLKINKDEKKI